MKKKPIIGIVLDLPMNSKNNKYSASPWYALRTNYAKAIIEAEGMPIFLPYNHQDLKAMADLINGLIIPGGDNDINPKLYNQKILSNKILINDTRTDFELAFFNYIKDRNLPFLGICSGMQLLNVALGGSLIQHIPDHFKSEINHQQPKTMDKSTTHSIEIAKDSLLYSINDNYTEAKVNSNHHQAVDKIGKGLKISAKAPDGVIEAIESTDHKFMLGVEWHPEYLNTSLCKNLFKKFVDAC